MLGLGFALTNFGTKGGVVDTPDLSGSSAAALLAAYGGEGFSMIFDSAAPSLKITDSTTPSNDWDSDLGDGYSVQDFFKSRSFTSYTGPVSSGKRLMQADGYIKPCRHNLIPMSNRFGSAAWTRTAATSTYGQTDVDGGATASLITESNTSTSVLYNATAFTTAANVPYTISCKIKKGNSTWVRLAFGTSGGTFTNGVQQWYNLDTVATGTAATTGTASYISSSITATTNSYYILTLTASQASTTGAFIVSTATADASATRTTSGAYYICHAMCNSGSSVLDYVSSEAHNICLQSQDVTTTWSNDKTTDAANSAVAPDGTTTADSVIDNASAGVRHIVFQTATGMIATPTTFSTYVKAGTRGFAYVAIQDSSSKHYGLTINLSTGAAGDTHSSGSPVNPSYTITSVGNSWYRVGVTITPTAGTGYIIIGGADSATPASYDTDCPAYNGDGVSLFYVWGMQLELASSPGKYVATTAAAVYNQHFDIPVEYNTNGTVKALVREEARTNLIIYSNFESTSSTWSTQAGAVLTSGTVTGPDGIANSAATLAIGTADVSSCFKASSPIAGAGTYTVSVYAKGSVGGEPFNIITYNATDGEQDGPTETLTTDWVLYSATFTQTTTTNTYFGRAAGGSASTIYVWGAQCEAGATASSRIRTGSAAVTRAADVISMSNKIVPGTNEYTFYFKGQNKLTDSTYSPTVSIGSADSNNHMTMAFYDYDIRTGVATSAVSQADVIGAANTVLHSTTHKLASRLKDNDVNAVYNGTALTADTSCTMPTTTVYNLQIGNRSSGSASTIEAHEIMVLPTGLADATLQTLTTA